MLPARRRWWRRSPHTSSVLRPTRSGPRVRRPPDARVRAPAGSSAVGSANSFRMRFANSSWRISGCETRSAGRCSTVDSPTSGLAWAMPTSNTRSGHHVISFGTVGCFWPSPQRGGALELSSPTGHSLDVPGARLYFEVQGSGPVLMLVGHPMDSSGFAAIAPLLADDHTVVSYDPRGFGRSTIDDRRQDAEPDLLADDVRRVLEA